MENEEKAKGIFAILKDLAKGEATETVKLTSELADGSYTLEDGTKFEIVEGNVINVVAPDAEAAEAEEAAKVAEDAEAVEMAKAKENEIAELKAANEKLNTEIVELSKTKKIIPTPSTKKLEKIELNAHMTFLEKADAILYNRINKLK